MGFYLNKVFIRRKVLNTDINTLKWLLIMFTNWFWMVMVALAKPLLSRGIGLVSLRKSMLLLSVLKSTLSCSKPTAERFNLTSGTLLVRRSLEDFVMDITFRESVPF